MTNRIRRSAIGAGALAAVIAASFAAEARTPPSAPHAPAPRSPMQAPSRDAPAAPKQQEGSAPQEIPWPVLLGLRAAHIEANVPVLDRVVLVPDEAAFLDEVSRWSPFGHWPVLIEDSRFAPRFIRAFKPKAVLRRTDRVPPLPEDHAERRALIEKTLVTVWGGDSTKATPLQVYRAINLEPAGLVVTREVDPAWTAALALAAGRGQMLGFVDGSWGIPSDVLDADAFSRLAGAVNDLFRNSGLPYADLGDALDACTLCMSTAAKCTPNLPAAARFAAQGAPPTDPADPLAVTDCLGRHDDGRRYAICASIWGDAPRCVAMAMSSLFLERSSYTFFNSYGESGEVGPFAVATIEQKFEPEGYSVNITTGQAATLRTWQRFGVGGLSTDALFVNSSGDCFGFDLGLPGRTSADDHADALDVPVLNKPLALQFVHSFSLQAPQNDATIGARWLDHGVYAYAGSVQEPFMSAFVPPREVMERIAVGVPFLVAARQLQGPFAVPWRIMTIGDPLMTCMPPSKPRRDRRDPASGEPRSLVPPGTRELADVRELATAALRDCKSDPTPSNFERAFLELDRLGDDAIATSLWQIAASKGASSSAGCARAALGALYRVKDTEAFVEAFKSLSSPDGEALDMLWGLMTPRLGMLDSTDAVDLLAKWPRPSRPQVDLVRLAPAMARVRGTPAARAMILRASESAKDPTVKEDLRRAATQF